MSQAERLGRTARTLAARLQNLAGARAPDAPAAAVRDPWPGDPGRGARLVKGDLEFLGAALALTPGVFSAAQASPVMRAHLHGFTWLRDLRALGTDAARGRARALVGDFLNGDATEPAADVTGARLAAWLGHYDFFAASASDEFRQALMGRIVTDARTLAAALPAEALDGRALTALKGLAAASVAMPDHAGYLPRVTKFLLPELGRQYLADGVQAERSPAAHLASLQDLTELRALIQAGGGATPDALVAAIEAAAAALRALRHGDGGLALFNGSREEAPALIDLVLAQTGRARGPLASLNASGLLRVSAGKTLLFMDAGAPAAAGRDRLAHAGALSFEFSSGRERVVVNCGAAPAAAGAWRDALRSSAAHSTLTIADVSAAEIRGEGLSRRPDQVTATRSSAAGASWIEASHDGWGRLFGAVHHRRLGLFDGGDELRGEDLIEAAEPQPFAIRFHLHPNVTVSALGTEDAVLLRTAGGQGFKLRAAGAPVRVEESVYFGQAEPRRAEQVVLAGHQDGPQHVTWSIVRV